MITNGRANKKVFFYGWLLRAKWSTSANNATTAYYAEPIFIKQIELLLIGPTPTGGPVDLYLADKLHQAEGALLGSFR